MKTEERLTATIEGLQTVGQRYVVLTLKAAAGFSYQAGQFTQASFTDAEGRFSKYYSIASAPRIDHRFDLCLLLDDTRLRRWIMDQTLGGEVDLSPAGGRFYVPPLEREVVMVAGGSGVTPLRAIMEARAQNESAAPTRLLYGCQNDLEIPFYSELLALAALQPQMRVSFFADEVVLGRAQLGRPLHALQMAIKSDCDYLLCGPPPLMKAAQATLLEGGIAPAHIHQDRF